MIIVQTKIVVQSMFALDVINKIQPASPALYMMNNIIAQIARMEVLNLIVYIVKVTNITTCLKTSVY